MSLLLIVFLVSCKSKAVVVDKKPVAIVPIKPDSVMNAQRIIEQHYGNKNDFSTLYIRSSAKYRDDKQTQNVSAEIKIKKNEKILVSIRFLGFTMAKALITPTSVQYYEKINGTYFEGNYEALSQWLGTNLDFTKIQNMLIGQPIDDLTKENFDFMLFDKSYKLSATNNKTEKAFFFDSTTFLLQKQEMVQPEQERMFEANYNNFQEFTTMTLPGNLQINATQIKGKTEILIDYNSATFNEELSFPYSVPEGYERIFIN
jgi:hypothetical protein